MASGWRGSRRAAVRGIRGAITAEANTKTAILGATTEMLTALIKANSLDPEDIAAAWFTTTPDLNAEFPAVAARRLGWTEVALMCGHEMSVPDGMPRVVRVLVLVNTDKRQSEVVNVYLRETRSLRARGTETEQP
ncbi:MAG: chorismate mutase [Candidatus Rokubacteria bacterium]|nr:chorismate mutase [Candidatus Rokubacteria bacterium]